MNEGWIVRVRGLVQGVGFRPTVWQLARIIGALLAACATPPPASSSIWLAARAERDGFLAALTSCDQPTLARIDRACRSSLQSSRIELTGFAILAKRRRGRSPTSVVADAVICEACAAEICDPSNRRFGYAFANCTHCGPAPDHPPQNSL